MNKTVIKLLDFRIEEKCLHYGRFSLGPFNIGQGITVGNSLRRTLISDLPGIAITSVDIRNPVIDHEFSSILGVRESVLEILLNLKEISFIQESSEISLIQGIINITGPKKITAKDILLPSDSTIKVVDPDQYIATTLDPNLNIELALNIEQGKGYKCFEDSKMSFSEEQVPDQLGEEPQEAQENNSSNSSSRKLPIDAIFRPVKKVNFVVEDRNLNKEQLILEVWTNGSIHPQKAVDNAANILVHLFTGWNTKISEDYKNQSYSPPGGGVHESKHQVDSTSGVELQENLRQDANYKEILIEDLKLSVRSYNCLKRAQIHTVSDLLNYSKENLLEIKNFGLKSADEIIEALQKHLGICLPK